MRTWQPEKPGCLEDIELCSGTAPVRVLANPPKLQRYWLVAFCRQCRCVDIQRSELGLPFRSLARSELVTSPEMKRGRDDFEKEPESDEVNKEQDFASDANGVEKGGASRPAEPVGGILERHSETSDSEEEDEELYKPKRRAGPTAKKGSECPYLDTISRQVRLLLAYFGQTADHHSVPVGTVKSHTESLIPLLRAELGFRF